MLLVLFIFRFGNGGQTRRRAAQKAWKCPCGCWCWFSFGGESKSSSGHVDRHGVGAARMGMDGALLSMTPTAAAFWQEKQASMASLYAVRRLEFTFSCAD